MPKGGKREGTGRKPGSITLRNRELLAHAYNGVTPLEHMLKVMRTDLLPDVRATP
jgi:hypothetical protein